MSTIFNLAPRGYHVAYHGDRVTHCPGCGRSHWMVGRLLAECGFCATAIPLANGHIAGGLHSRNFRPIEPIAA